MKTLELFELNKGYRKMAQRIRGYDLTRTFAIIIVFLAHIILVQCDNRYSTIIFTSISPGLTMSLLAFISASLLTDDKLIENNYSIFLFRRLTRIYIPVILCLTFAVILTEYYGLKIQVDDLIYNYLGIGLFYDWLEVPNNTSVGWGLWFVTAILIMYILLPVLKLILNHKNGILHLILLYLFCVIVNIITMPPETSFWNVAISFCLGVYLSTNQLLPNVLNAKLKFAIPLALLILTACLLSTSGIISFDIRKLIFPLYPIAFIPLFFRLSNYLPGFLETCIKKFSKVSFEFYILQFYFINGSFKMIFGDNFSLLAQIIIGFLADVFVAIILYEIGNRLRKAIDSYFLLDYTGSKNTGVESVEYNGEYVLSSIE